MLFLPLTCSSHANYNVGRVYSEKCGTGPGTRIVSGRMMEGKSLLIELKLTRNGKAIIYTPLNITNKSK